MKNKFFRVLFPAAVLGLSIMLTAYAANSSNASETTAAESTISSKTSEASETSEAAEGADGEKEAAGEENTSSDEWYSDRDMEQSPDTSDTKTIEVTDGQTLSITEEGTYILQGTASDCTVLVNAPEAKVQLILDNVTVTNTSSPVIYVLDADKCFVTTAEGSENALTVSGTFTEDTENDVKTDAVIFAKSDLTLNGKGTLTISSTDNGITSKDELTVTGGTYNITASGKGLESNDSTAICDGTFTIDAKEGMESTYVRIDGGTFEISASDDGINAAANSDKNNVQVEINGGTLSIKMGAGDTDGIDSNGDLTINGGNISIECNSPFDYDGTGTSSEVEWEAWARAVWAKKVWPLAALDQGISIPETRTQIPGARMKQMLSPAVRMRAPGRQMPEPVIQILGTRLSGKWNRGTGKRVIRVPTVQMQLPEVLPPWGRQRVDRESDDASCHIPEEETEVIL